MTGSRARARIVLAVAVTIALIGAAFLIFRPGSQASAGVNFANPEAWIEHGLEGELLKINGSTGEVTTRIEVAANGADLGVAPRGNGAAVIDRAEGQLTIIDGQRLDSTLQVELDLSTSLEDRELEVYASPNVSSGVVVADSNQLMVVDPLTSVVESIPLADPLESVALADTGRLVALTSNDELLSVVGQTFSFLDDAPPAVTVTQSRHLVSAGGSVFLMDPSRLTTTAILESGQLDTSFCLSGASTGEAMFGGSSPSEDPLIVSFNPETGMVALASPTTGCEELSIDIDSNDEFAAPVVHRGFVYLANVTQALIHVIDIEQAAEVAQLPFGRNGLPFTLDIRGASVWANQPTGTAAAVLDGPQITPVVKIESVVAGAVVVDEEGDEEGDGAVGRGEGPEDDGGLRILGTTGAAVLAAEDTEDGLPSDQGQGGDEASDQDEVTNEVETAPPLGVGVAASAVAPAQELAPEEDLGSVETEELIANFAASTTTATVGEPVRFTDFSSGGPVSWTWDFGDGTGARDQTIVEKAWDVDGSFLVELTVTNEAGEEASQAVEVVVVPEEVQITPTADFTFDRNTIEVGERVIFTDRSSGTPSSLQWDFGDGTGDLGEVVTHVFDEAGTFLVTLTAANDVGSTTASTEITVLASVSAPEAAIGSIPDEIVNGQLITLRSESLNGPTQISWDFGDGERATGETVRHAWEDPGTYRVRLEVSNSAGTDTAFIDVQVFRRVDPPVARFAQTATEVVVDEVVTFNDLSTNQPTAWNWDFGDGTTRRGEMVNKRWDAPGVYRVTLAASNEAGTGTTSVMINVIQPVDPPSAAFAISATVAAPGDAITFTDQSANTPTEFVWDFGDGTTSTRPSPTHAYEAPGTYQVTLRASNEGGTSIASQQVVVVARPVADFEFAIDGRTVSFMDASMNGEIWVWDFGDGTSSAARNPEHTFEEGGVFDVTLVVRNPAGASAPATARVRIVEPPVAVATCAVVGRTLECDGSASENAVEFLWINGAAVVNTTPRQAQTVFAFETSARRTIVLRVTAADGQQAETSILSPRVLAGLEPEITDITVTQEGDLVRLEAAFENDPVTWNWELEDAQLVQGGNGPFAVFRVPSDGRFDGEVTAENAFGEDTDALRVNVSDFEPEASFTWEVIGPGLVELTNTSEAVDGFTVVWRTPGNDEVTVNNRTRRVVQYPLTGGRFDATITVTDAFGEDVFEDTIVVPGVEPPEASFTWEVVGPGLVEFTNTSEVADGFTVVWRTPGSEDVPARNRQRTTVQYPLEGGRFDVSLEVRDDFGEDTFETTITVPAVEQETVLGFTLRVIEPGVVEAINTSTAGDGVDFRWQASGEEEILVRSDERFVVRFAEGGTYEIRLFDDDSGDRLFQDVVVPDF